MRPPQNPRRPPGHSERSETASSLQPSAPSCHSERSEESWLGFNPAETNETRRKTPVGRLVIPSASEESWLDFNLTETNETRRKTPQAALSFRAQRDRFLSAAFRSLLSFRAQRDRFLSAAFRSPFCHSERSEESWLGLNPAESDENIRNASHDSSLAAPSACFEQGSLYLGTLFSRGEKEKGRNRPPTVSPKASIPHLKYFASTIYVCLPTATWPS